MSARPLVFVVGTGRTGSTVLSNILRMHPEIISINEFFISVQRDALPTEPLTGKDFWAILSRPNMAFDTMVANGTPLPEFLYTRTPGRRFSATTTGIPALSHMVLPHLTDDPDDLFDVLAGAMCDWPKRPVALHYEAMFDLLAARFGGRVVVERSGESLMWIPRLRETFPHARYVHMFRDGLDCAVSMSRHTAFRGEVHFREILERTGLESVLDLTPEHLRDLPPDLALFAKTFDYTAVQDRPIPIGRFGALWSRMITKGLDHLAEIPATERTSLRYEELLTSRRPELIRLAEFIGVDPDPEWLRASSDILDGSRVGAATRLAPDELAALRQSCEPGLSALSRGVPSPS